MASSCCLLQLALNVLSVGCAGFNTYLGPVRPYFFSLFVVLQTDAALKIWSAAIQGKSSAAQVLRRAAWSLAQVGVALLPEALDVYNRWRNNKRADLATDDASMALKATIRLEVPTMGCVACVNTIDAALNRRGIAQRARVLRASSALHPLGEKGGSVAIEAVAESDAALAELVSKLIGAAGSAGFAGATVASIRKQDIAKNGATGEL